jgi:hypothetical protein
MANNSFVSTEKAFVLPSSIKAQMFKALFVALELIRENEKFDDTDPRFKYVADIFIDAHCVLAKEAEEDGRVREITKTV